MSEYAKNIQTIEDIWKKRIELPKLTEIVRCRDCEHYESNTIIACFTRAHEIELGTCDMKLEETGKFFAVMADGFCSWGERK